ncbi:unnamed protein product, partial [Sphenostylis stenocarpa]
KIVRSRDVVFLEDQTIEDINKKEKSRYVAHKCIDVEPEPPTSVINYGRDVNADLENVDNMFETQANEPTE